MGSRVFAAVALAASLALSGCGKGDDSDKQSTVPVVQLVEGAPAYCGTLGVMPSGLADAVQDAIMDPNGAGSNGTLTTAVEQLRAAANIAGAPADLKSNLNTAADLLQKLADGKSLTLQEARKFQVAFANIGKAVDTACKKH